MTFNPTEMAEKALTQPSDSYFGNDNLWITHGMSGFSKNRDSGCLEIANFKTVIHILENEFGPQDADGLWWINYSTHWAVGWVDQIMVKIVINKDNRIDDINNITDIFKRCLEIHDELEVDPVLDEQIYSEILDEVTINNINSYIPVWTNNSPEHIWEALSYMEIMPSPDDNGECVFFEEDEIYIAAFMIGNHETESVWFDDMVKDLERILETDYPNNHQLSSLKDELVDFINFVNS